jgi:hypothetical protein
MRFLLLVLDHRQHHHGNFWHRLDEEQLGITCLEDIIMKPKLMLPRCIEQWYMLGLVHPNWQPFRT